jgi:hypothetical protein
MRSIKAQVAMVGDVGIRHHFDLWMDWRFSSANPGVLCVHCVESVNGFNIF